MNNTTQMSALEAERLLSSARYDIYMRFLPVIIIMAALGVIGLVGNILTLVFYSLKTKRSSSQIQIVVLACADIFVCLLIIANILEMVANVSHNQPVLCKIAHFLGLWSIESSALTLWIIAIDRHRKICKPFGRQITTESTRKILFGVIIYSCLMGVRNFANFDTVAVNVKVADNQTVTGHFCTTRDDPKFKLSVTIFTAIDFLTVLLVWTTLMVVYPHIVFTIIKMERKKKKRRENKSPKKQEMKVAVTSGDESEANISKNDHELGSNNGPGYSHDMTSDETQLTSASTSTTAVGHVNPQHIVKHDVNGANPADIVRNRTKADVKDRQSRRIKPIKSASERTLTFMMLTVSIVFILCFSPYFAVKIVMRLVLHKGEEYEFGVGIQFALRLVYLNSVFNPIVYCAFNPQFRIYVKNFFRSVYTVPSNIVRKRSFK